jgi:hypothetical protein
VRRRLTHLDTRACLIGVIVAALLATVSAIAFWSTSATGSGAGGVGSLASTSIAGATPGPGTVALSWGAVTPPGSGPVTYYVTRDGGGAAGNCASAGSPSAATSCTDSGLVPGTYEYTVTAIWHSWTAKSAAKSVTVTTGATTQLVLEAASTTPTAGAGDALTIKAEDSEAHVVTSYAGSKSLTFSGASAIGPNQPTVSNSSGTATTFGTPTTITFTNGVAKVSGASNGVMTLYKAGSASITVSDGSVNNGSGLPVTVSPAGTASFVVPTPATQTAGTAFEETITAKDTYGNVATGYAGTKALAFSGPGTSPNGKAPSYPANVSFIAGAGTASVTLYRAESTTLAATEGAVTGSTASFTVSPASAASFVVPTPATQTAGTSFEETITARDAYGNLATGYTGTKAVAFSGPGTSPNAKAPAYPANVSFTAGAGTASVTLYKAETTTLTAKEGTITGTSGSFAVEPAGASSFSLSTPGATAGTAFEETLTAKDLYGNTATGYTGTRAVAFSGPGTSPSGKAPSYPESVSFAAGVGTASITLYKAETTTLTAKEGTIAGTSASFTVTPAAANSFTLSTPSPTVGTAFEETVTAKDLYGNTALGYTGAKTVAFSGPAASPNKTAPTYPSSVTFTAGVGTASVTLYKAETTMLTAKEGTITGTSASFTVSTGATSSISVANLATQAQSVAFNVSLTATDVGGNGVSGSLPVSFTGPSNAPDGTAPTYPANVTFAGGSGTASVTLFDAQSTTLTVKQGTASATSTSFTVTAGTAKGLIFTSASTKAGAITPTCTGLITALSCKAESKSSGNTRFFKANVSLVDAHQNVTTNTGGSEITVSLVQSGGESVSPTSVKIANGASASTLQFEMKLKNGESPGTVTASATVAGTAVTSSCTAT